MPALRLLLVDDDAWTESLVSSVLRKRGYEVQVAHSLAHAANLISDPLPDVIICEAVLAAGDEVSQLFVDHAKLKEVSRLVLTALPEHEPRVAALDGDAYLGKPFRFVDLDAAVERALQFHKRRLAAQTPPESEPPRDSVLRSGVNGTLDQIGLASLLTMIEMERKSGILLLRRGNASARLYCKEGRILSARLFGATRASGVDVVFKLLTWTDGHFNFTAMPVSVSDEIGRRITHLLLEGARRHDEADPPNR